jgi:hypothetical protein
MRGHVGDVASPSSAILRGAGDGDVTESASDRRDGHEAAIENEDSTVGVRIWGEVCPANSASTLSSGVCVERARLEASDTVPLFGCVGDDGRIAGTGSRTVDDALELLTDAGG